MFYVNLMVTTKQKSIVGTQKIKRRESRIEYHHIEYHHITKKKAREKERKKELQNRHKITNKMVTVNPHLSIIALNVNGLDSPIKRRRKTEWVNKIAPNYMLPIGNPFQH